MYAKGSQYRLEEFKMLRDRSEPKLEEWMKKQMKRRIHAPLHLRYSSQGKGHEQGKCGYESTGSRL